jgi:NADPH:quinone reductase-like Zn-dependent oxidoreductase
VQAEYICAPEDFIMFKPETLSWEETAAFPLAYLTAYHMIFRKLHLNDSQTILIWGASSGIGSAAIQIAQHIGSTIITTVGSNEKLKHAEQLGAAHCINYKEENVSQVVHKITDGKGVDAVFEHVGESSWSHSIRSLKKGGKLVTCGATTGPYVRLDLRHLFIKHLQIIGSTMGNRKDLVEICSLIEHGIIKPPISTVYNFEDIQTAHQLLEDNRQMGKIVLRF